MITNKNFNKFLDSILNESFDGYDESGKPQFNMNYEDSYFRGCSWEEIEDIICNGQWWLSYANDRQDDDGFYERGDYKKYPQYPYKTCLARYFNDNTWRFMIYGGCIEINKNYLKNLSNIKLIPTSNYINKSYNYEMRHENEERLLSKTASIKVDPKKFIKAIYFARSTKQDLWLYQDDEDAMNEMVSSAKHSLKIATEIGIPIYYIDKKYTPVDKENIEEFYGDETNKLTNLHLQNKNRMRRIYFK